MQKFSIYLSSIWENDFSNSSHFSLSLSFISSITKYIKVTNKRVVAFQTLDDWINSRNPLLPLSAPRWSFFFPSSSFFPPTPPIFYSNLSCRRIFAAVRALWMARVSSTPLFSTLRVFSSLRYPPPPLPPTPVPRLTSEKLIKKIEATITFGFCKKIFDPPRNLLYPSIWKKNFVSYRLARVLQFNSANRGGGKLRWIIYRNNASNY